METWSGFRCSDDTPELYANGLRFVIHADVGYIRHEMEFWPVHDSLICAGCSSTYGRVRSLPHRTEQL